ncbi:MAG: hypothetical protein M3R57_06125, partial [Chloroflexota bacterium]|nr:hypothetical protein [Chloroflexota bacterium]
TGRVPGVAATTLWRAEDQRPRWIRRFEEQVPARSRSALESDDEPMPWLDAVAWSALEGSDEDLIAR